MGRPKIERTPEELEARRSAKLERVREYRKNNREQVNASRRRRLAVEREKILEERRRRGIGDSAKGKG